MCYQKAETLLRLAFDLEGASGGLALADIMEPFERREDFSRQDYSGRAFGVFQEEAADVVWRFSPAAAADARSFLFHPTQEMEEALDGALIVRFRAGGHKEMCWHLFTWGAEVEVLAPEALRRMYAAMVGGAIEDGERKALIDLGQDGDDQ